MFVGREKELERLNGLLQEARAGRGRTVFLSGEAGSGKSALAGEFVRRAQASDDEIVAATGECNAQTGAGDPYLPFRQVLAELVGAGDGKQPPRGSSETNAARLREFVRVASATLLEVGPDLIGLFIPGGTLLAKIATSAARQGKLADKLVANLKGAPSGASTAASVDQERIFEQYAQVLAALSRERTLILVLDDLHWADGASVNLLFHLARALKESRILIIGTYRPDDVAVGRGGAQPERHPLEPVLNEIKRYEGDVVIAVGLNLADEGRRFVGELIDSEPNCLDEGFRNELYERTEGHALFTTELLRTMEERGDLARDETGCWRQAPELDWQDLPARVEGVIAERLARLPAELREELAVGSIMGRDFAAQVIAELKGLPERGVVQQLSRDLDRRHHLVQEIGERRVGRRFLSWYSFVHILFQQFLYDEMGPAERRMLHGDVAAVLEKLYADQTDEIAIDLARHFEQAGEDEKAVAYLLCAGDQAFKVYAHNEAVDYYSRALELGRDGLATSEQLLNLYTRRGRALELLDRYDAALANYEEMQAAGQARSERKLELEGLLLRSLAYAVGTDLLQAPRAQALALDALSIAHQFGDRAAEAKAYWVLMLANRFANEGPPKAVEYGERSLGLARESGSTVQLAYTLKDLGLAYVLSGHFDKALGVMDETVGLWRQLGDKPMLSDALIGVCMGKACSGHLEEGLVAGEEAYKLNVTIHNRFGITLCATFVGWTHMQLGHVEMALRRGLEGVGRAGDLGHAAGPWIWGLIDLAGLYDYLGDADQALQHVKHAIDSAESGFPQARAYGQAALAIIHLHRGNAPAARALLQDLPDLTFEAYARGTGGPWWFVLPEAHTELALAKGDFGRGLALADEASALAERIGMTIMRLPSAHLKARALVGLGRMDEALAVLQEATAEAAAFQARYFLLPMLSTVHQLEMGLGHEAEARAAAIQGADVVSYIANHTPPELRTAFTGSQGVATLLRAASRER